MDIIRLKTEIDADPLTRGYAGMTDAQVKADGHTKYRTRNKTSLTGSEVLNAIDKTEFNSKTDAQKQQVWDLVHLGTLNPFGIEASLMVDIFGGGSVTIVALQALRVESISRWEELSLGNVREGHIQKVRVS